ncbi:DEKNAAC103359 [Brettanomyces naardenensis]|uniref:DEKNAAC103359 n=1 Tax=Brettanomyces naardenensis TaxID=13370 RepID=A0A448YNY4_BRENA|nr:DEKNAAC103359 [Brettanomyces naardenensis]
MRRDFAYYHYFEVAATSLFIACKAEECRRKLADVVKVCASMALQGRMSEKIDEDSSIYWKWKDVITNLEELLLEVLCFDVTPENPYKICLKTLGLEFDEDVTTTGTQDKEKAQRLFLQCTNFYELLSRLPLVLMYRTEVICGLGIVLGCKKDEEGIDCLEGIGDKLGVEVEEVWRCYCMIMEVSKALEPLGSAFQILGSIPRIERSEMEKMLNKR